MATKFRRPSGTSDFWSSVQVRNYSDFEDIGVPCGADLDEDSVDNDEDNCPLDPNVGQEDDWDDVGDRCDIDCDGDGFDEELLPLKLPSPGLASSPTQTLPKVDIGCIHDDRDE